MTSVIYSSSRKPRTGHRILLSPLTKLKSTGDTGVDHDRQLQPVITAFSIGLHGPSFREQI